MTFSKPFFLGALGGLILIACIGYWRSHVDQITVGNEKSLSTATLAKGLLGEKIGSKVIEVVRHYREGIPDYAEFYTQPEFGAPQLNGICRTDVITLEYGWRKTPTTSTPLKIIHVEAIPRYKSFPVPPGEPGTPANDQAQAAACANMKTARDAFRAPSSGDAQWLAAITGEYRAGSAKFAFTCNDFADASCKQARRLLSSLQLAPSTDVKVIDCPKEKTGDQMDECFSLTFPYHGHMQYSDNQDMREVEDYEPEWVLTIFAGMKDGFSPVRIRSLNMEHVQKPLIMS